jgi:dephospho-CoA kinase
MEGGFPERAFPGELSVRNDLKNPPTCVIGILGGIASGKSTLAREFARLGAKVVDADKIGHRVLERPETKREVRATWGDAVFNDDGTVDRKRLGETVFRDRRELERLSAIVHPPILEALRQEVAASEVPVVLDAALLDEFTLTALCDHLVFVEASDSVRQERAARQRHWPADEVQRRESFQNPKEAKREKADFVIENDGDIGQLRRNAERVWLAIGLNVPCTP